MSYHCTLTCDFDCWLSEWVEAAGGAEVEVEVEVEAEAEAAGGAEVEAAGGAEVEAEAEAAGGAEVEVEDVTVNADDEVVMHVQTQTQTPPFF